ncbi:hypothetical protein H5410_058378 [Solanum commersonii]|uniref:Uncharacterized protein n=1 Tax=Solanum commersonii TaxID=4109 RepID=A0A9J5WSY5_SOLCO|nr:hypothetical protein H5410_058378 [Solanum commersonii]
MLSGGSHLASLSLSSLPCSCNQQPGRDDQQHWQGSQLRPAAPATASNSSQQTASSSNFVTATVPATPTTSSSSEQLGKLRKQRTSANNVLELRVQDMEIHHEWNNRPIEFI